jgi:hypothetical protein
MNLFGDTLQKIAQRLLGESQKKKLIAQALTEFLHTPISEDALLIKDEVLKIRISPTIKTAVLLNQTAVMEFLKQKGIQVRTIE